MDYYTRFIKPVQGEQYASEYDADSSMLADLIGRDVSALSVRTLDLSTAGSIAIELPSRGFVPYFWQTSSDNKTRVPEGLVSVFIGTTQPTSSDQAFPAKHNRGFRGSFVKCYISWLAQADTSVDIVFHKSMRTPWMTDDFDFQTLLLPYVPYTGATQSVNLGSNAISAQTGQFSDLLLIDISTSGEGEIYYSNLVYYFNTQGGGATDIAINFLRMFDTPNGDYGRVELSDNIYLFYETDGSTFASIRIGSLFNAANAQVYDLVNNTLNRSDNSVSVDVENGILAGSLGGVRVAWGDAGGALSGDSGNVPFQWNVFGGLGFYSTSPVAQPTNTAALDTLLVTLGLRATGGVALFDTDVKIGTLGKGLYIKEGANATSGVTTLVAGTKVVTTTKVTANSRIYLTHQALGTITVPVALAVSARTAGTSFTILSGNLIDTSVVAWVIVEPA